MSRDFGTIIEIGDILVSEEVVTEFFACDYPACKGRCCIVGDSGAPLLEEELEPLERDYPEYSQLMSEAGRTAVGAKGFFEIDRDGDIVTPLVEGTRECAFCRIDCAGNCRCVINSQKPVSCSLYPIRAVRLGGGRIGLNLHRWDICAPAYEKGKREKVRVYEFLREPLERAYGEEFYRALSAAAGIVIRGC